MEFQEIKSYFEEKFKSIDDVLRKIEKVLARQAEQIMLTEKRVTILETKTDKRPTFECENFFKQHITSDSHIEYIKQMHKIVHDDWDKAKKDEMRSNAGFIRNLIGIAQIIFPIIAIIAVAVLK